MIPLLNSPIPNKPYSLIKFSAAERNHGKQVRRLKKVITEAELREERISALRQEADLTHKIQKIPDPITLSHHKQMFMATNLGPLDPLLNKRAKNQFEEKRAHLLISAPKGSNLWVDGRRTDKYTKDFRVYWIETPQPVTFENLQELHSKQKRLSDVASSIVKTVTGSQQNSRNPRVKNAYYTKANRFKIDTNGKLQRKREFEDEVPENSPTPLPDAIRHFLQAIKIVSETKA